VYIYVNEYEYDGEQERHAATAADSAAVRGSG
jgi:hypothetical protein